MRVGDRNNDDFSLFKFEAQNSLSGTYRIKNMGTKKFVEVGKGSSQCLRIDDDQTVDAFCYARADKDKVSKQNS
jgi:hypothetical protein